MANQKKTSEEVTKYQKVLGLKNGGKLITKSIEYQLYLLDKKYKDSSNLNNYVEESQNFYNGNQYPNENFKNMVRVTENFISFAENIKASKVCGTPIYLTFTADNNDVDCSALREFDEYNCKKLDLDSSNFQAALNGFVNGTEITYIRWDEDDTTYKGIYKGGLVEENLDIRNFAVANPYIREVQNQEWVMYWCPMPVKTVIDMCEIDAYKEEIKRENVGNEEDSYMDRSVISSSLITVYTRFFRINGEVFFMCSIEDFNLFKEPHPLSRKLGKNVIKNIVEKFNLQVENNEYTEDLVRDLDIDKEDIPLNITKFDEFTDEEYKKSNEKFSLYPFAIFRPFAINRSFYGRSDTKQMIPIQKGINFALSMMLKCAENNAYNKIFAKEGALGDQEITNEPSQVIFDYSGFTNTWGIKFAESQPMPNGLIDFTERLFNMTRVVYGFNDVMDGSLATSDMSGYLYQQMVQQANTSIAQQQKLFWKYNVEKAQIRLMYYKHYVDKARYVKELTDSEYDGEEQARTTLYNTALNGNGIPTNPDAKPEDFKNPSHRVKVQDLNMEDMWGTNFDIAIDAVQGLNDSKLAEQQMFDNLLLNGGIQNISPDILNMYLQASPNVSPRTKAALKNVIENLKQSENENLKAQLNDMAAKTEQIIQYAKGLEAQLDGQKNFIDNLQKEFEGRINQANTLNQGLMKELDKYKTQEQQISEGEVKSNNARGVEGTTTK